MTTDVITDLDNYFDKDSEGNFDFFSTKLTTIVQDFKDKSYEEYIVTSKDENTPDLISWLYYGTMKYWWFICLINGIDDPFDISAGTKLKMYNADTIYQYLTNVLNGNNSNNNNTISYGNID